MTRDEVVCGLERVLRQVEDAACAEEAVSRMFAEVFRELQVRRPVSPEAHLRLLELDPYVNGARRAAQSLRDDAAVLRAAIVELSGMEELV